MTPISTSLVVVGRVSIRTRPLRSSPRPGRGRVSARAWRSIPFDRQSEIVQRLLNEPDEDALISFLIEECDLSDEQAQAASSARLPQGHGHIGPSMLEELVDVLQNDSVEVVDPQTGEILPRPLTYDQAVVRLGSHHSHFTGERRERLPYYGEVLARHVIANPDAAGRQSGTNRTRAEPDRPHCPQPDGQAGQRPHRGPRSPR